MYTPTSGLERRKGARMTTSPTSDPKAEKPVEASKPTVVQSRSYVRHFKRLLSSFLEEHDLGEAATIGQLIETLDREIVKDALRQ